MLKVLLTSHTDLENNQTLFKQQKERVLDAQEQNAHIARVTVHKPR
jgi:hypothetical protein